MLYQITQPFTLTIFGASGDLAKLKIFPTLYELALQKRFQQPFTLIGYGRTTMTDDAFKIIVKESIEKKWKEHTDQAVLQTILDNTIYVTGQYTEQQDFVAYKQKRNAVFSHSNAIHLAYLSVPPQTFEPIIEHLGTIKEADEDLRLIIEKPFGKDKQSAEHLYHFISKYFTEEQIYLLDHYLGKSSVQSILHLRRANRLLSYMLKGEEIANIQITAAETLGVGERIGYFEQVGTVRDMMQSHLLQILSLITMNIPMHLTPESVAREKHAMLAAIDCPCDPSNVILGQYDSYNTEVGKDTISHTETFAAVRLFLDHENWYNVPIYLRTGKKLHKKHTYVVVELKKFPFQTEEEEPNRLIIELQPEEKITITLINHQEDVNQKQSLKTSDSIACSIYGCLPDHATLLLEAIKGNRLYFLSFQEIIAAWEVVDNITKLSEQKKIPIHHYDSGSLGPALHLELPKKDGFAWYDIIN
jgi:glucose-6-phosphate 1-dehydrogenase